jgi:transcriptional regulator with XRE-family HTH domain
LGDHIRTKRLEKGLNQRKAAQLLGIWEKHFIQWELDRAIPSEAELACLAQLLGISITTPTANPTVE